jgi:phosphoribosylaminoimidazole-succinocarboxamide synthase
MARPKKIYEGKAKTLYQGPEPGTLVQSFKDDVASFYGQKTGTITGKGVLNNRISEFLMRRLDDIGIATHFMRRLNMRDQLVREAEVIPLQVVVHNVATDHFAKRFGIPDGTKLPRSIVEYFLKKDELHNPMVSEEHITGFGWATVPDVDDMMSMALRINDFLTGLFITAGIRLVDIELEFGRIYHESGDVQIILIDEISPDTCRLWDISSGERLDKDRFRMDLGNEERAYQEVARRLGIMPESAPHDLQGPITVQ